MIKAVVIRMKSKEDIEATLEDKDEWTDRTEATVNPYKERVIVMRGMIEAIAGKEIEVFPYKGHGDYKFRYWHTYENEDERIEKGVPAWYLLKEWVEKVIGEADELRTA